MDKYENDPIAMRDAGIAYAVSQIVDLIANDVDGIHLYTMNNPYIAEKICEAVKSLFWSTQTQAGGELISACFLFSTQNNCRVEQCSPVSFFHDPTDYYIV